MFRVPADPVHPTWHHAFKVTFGQWLRSTHKQRYEWFRRRHLANAYRRHDPVNAGRPGWSPAPTPEQAKLSRSLRRLRALDATLTVMQLLPLVMVMLCCCGGLLWFGYSYLVNR